MNDKLGATTSLKLFLRKKQTTTTFANKTRLAGNVVSEHLRGFLSFQEISILAFFGRVTSDALRVTVYATEDGHFRTFISAVALLIDPDVAKKIGRGARLDPVGLKA